MGSLSSSNSPLARKRCPEFGFSGLSASLIDLPVTHNPPPRHSHNDADFSVNAPLPCSVRWVCAPSLDPPQLRRRRSFVIRKSRTAIVPDAVIPPHFLDAENAFPEGKEDPPHSLWANSSETSVWMHNTNGTADVSPCDGISAILGQHKACAQIAMIMNGRGLSLPPSFGLRSLYAHTSYHLTWHTAPMIHRSHKLATMSSYSSCPLRLSFNGHLHHSRWI